MLLLFILMVLKRVLANSLSPFSIKDNPAFSNGPKSLLRDPPDCTILCNSAFDDFTLAEELFAKFYKALKLVYQLITN